MKQTHRYIICFFSSPWLKNKIIIFFYLESNPERMVDTQPNLKWNVTEKKKTINFKEREEARGESPPGARQKRWLTIKIWLFLNVCGCFMNMNGFKASAYCGWEMTPGSFPACEPNSTYLITSLRIYHNANSLQTRSITNVWIEGRHSDNFQYLLFAFLWGFNFLYKYSIVF